MNLHVLSLRICTSISNRQLNIVELTPYLTTDFVNVPIPSPWLCTTLTMCYVTMKCSLRNTGWIPCFTSCYNSSLHCIAWYGEQQLGGGGGVRAGVCASLCDW